MFFAKIKTPEQGEVTALYFDSRTYFERTFSPLTEVITLIEFKVSGKDYKARQESLRTLAVDWSNADISGISYSELAHVGHWFLVNGKRFGLLKEFNENAII